MEKISEILTELQEENAQKEQGKFQYTEFGKGYDQAINDLSSKLVDKSDKPSPWELIGRTLPGESECGMTYRMKVPGGWLVRVAEYIYSEKKNYSYKVHQDVVFVVDAEGSWKLEEKTEE